MAQSAGTGVEMPSDFPLAEHDKVTKRLGPYQPTHKELYTEYGGGWNGITYRFRACADADETFTASIKKAHAPPSEERLKQETALYTFFSAGYAVIESFVYAVHSIGAMLKPDGFPMKSEADLKKINTHTTTKRFAEQFPGTPLAERLALLLASDERKKFGNARNMLAHRGQPPRAFSMNLSIGADPGPGPTAWVNMGLMINEATTAERRSWLAKELENCTKVAATFVYANFPEKE